MESERSDVKYIGTYIYEGLNNIRLLSYAFYKGQEVEIVVISSNDNYIYIFDKITSKFINKFPSTMLNEFIKKKKSVKNN